MDTVPIIDLTPWLLGTPADRASAARQVDAALRDVGHTMNVNWYPALSRLGQPEPGQFRIGPHTDFGTVTILDRQDGVGCLRVCTPDGQCVSMGVYAALSTRERQTQP